MYKNIFISLLVALLCSLSVSAQPLVKETPLRGNHHTHRLPGVNERRLARLEKMRETNLALRHRQGPWRAQTVPQTKKGLVLLVQFSNEEMKSGAATQWYNRFNQQGFSQNSHVGSVRDYFIEQSYGMLTIDFDVVGPLTLTNTREYYGSSPNGNLSDRAAEMVIEALTLADPQVNYADYDWDNNGWVDQVYVIYAGITKAATQGYIWPHEWSLTNAKYWGCGSGRQSKDGVYINTYAVSNELADATRLEGIGTACHEFSHCLGYPDFYDTSYSGGTAGQYWDVLDAGSYNGPRYIGEVPSPYTAYERWLAGWIDLIPLAEPTKVKNMPAINQEGVAYIINNTGNSNEYYILENRQQVTFGTGNGGHGLMVWHVDYNRTAWNNNEVNTDVNHQRMTFLPADGQVGVLVQDDDGSYRYQISAYDEAGDPYPGNRNVSEVQPLTWFVAEKYGTKTHQNLIHDISETANGKINFTYGDYKALPTPELDYPTVLSETRFIANWLPVEGATSYTLQLEAMTGEPSPATVLAENFSGFKAAAADTQIGSSVIDKYTQTMGWTVSNIRGTNDASVIIGTISARGSMMTPALENRAGKLVVEFDAAYSDEGSSVIVTVLKGEQIFATQTIQLTAERETYSYTFDDIPSGCNVKFESTGRRKRFYLYNIDIKDMSGADSVITTITGLTSTSYTVVGANADIYYYRVQAICEDGSSDWSDWMDVDIASAISEWPAVSDSEEGRGETYDLSGRRLQQAPQQGLYIRNGKTYMVR